MRCTGCFRERRGVCVHYHGAPDRYTRSGFRVPGSREPLQAMCTEVTFPPPHRQVESGLRLLVLLDRVSDWAAVSRRGEFSLSFQCWYRAAVFVFDYVNKLPRACHIRSIFVILAPAATW